MICNILNAQTREGMHIGSTVYFVGLLEATISTHDLKYHKQENKEQVVLFFLH